MSDDLIKQWDGYVKRTGWVMGDVEHMAQQMRDRIAELERENAKLVSEVNIAKYGEPNFAWSIHNAVMADLQAKLAKAVETLREFAKQKRTTEMDVDEYDQADIDGAYCQFIFKARAVLAELEAK